MVTKETESEPPLLPEPKKVHRGGQERQQTPNNRCHNVTMPASKAGRISENGLLPPTVRHGFLAKETAAKRD